MRKSTFDCDYAQADLQSDESWFDVQNLATVEVTSEDPAFPIEFVFNNIGGWRAAKPGEQVIQLIFDAHQTIHRISLHFSETKIVRTQQFVLRWSNSEREATRRLFTSNGISAQMARRKKLKTIG